MIGELVHISITKTVGMASSLIDLLDRKTPDGTVGLLGFTILAFGFISQILATYLGRPAA